MVLARYKPIDPNLAELCRELENHIILWFRKNVFSKYKKTDPSGNVKNALSNSLLKDLVDKNILYYCYGRLKVKRPTGSRISKMLKDNYKIDTSDYLYGVDQAVVDYAMELKQKAEQNAREYIGFLSSDEVKKQVEDLDYGIFVTDMDEKYSEHYKDSIGKNVDHDDLRLKYLKEQYIENVKFWMSGVGSYELARFRTEGLKLLEQGTVGEFENYVKKRFAGSVTEQRIRFRIKQETALYNVAKESYQLVKDGYGQYIWKTKGDNRVRKDHQKLEGRICSWNDPPLADSRYGIYAHPGQTWNCYEKNTQVYTEKGFVLIKDVKIGDKVLTLNPDTKNLEWSICTGKVEKYAENIVHLSNNSFDLKVDPNHTFFVYKDVEHSKGIFTSEPQFRTGIEKLSKTCRFYRSSEWTGQVQNFIDIGNRYYPVRDFCILLGYYLSEGSVDNREDRNGIKISQSKYLDKMFEDLSFFNPKKGKDAIWIFDTDLKNYLKQFGYAKDKFIPQEIKNLDPKNIRIFLNAFALGDGTPSKKEKCSIMNNKKEYTINYYNSYRTSSKKLADDLVECIIKVGMSANIRIVKQKGKQIKFKNGTYTLNTDLFIVRETKLLYNKVDNMKKEILPYNDSVYDIEVEKNHTILIKSENSIHWNSNCRCVAIPIKNI